MNHTSPNTVRRHQRDVRVIFTLTVVSLCLENVRKHTARFDSKMNPAVSQCLQQIEEIFAQYPDNDPMQKVYRNRVNDRRIKFTKQVSQLSMESGLIGALRVLTTRFRTKPGTRIAFICDQFRENLPAIEKAFLKNEREVKEFEYKFWFAIRRV